MIRSGTPKLKTYVALAGLALFGSLALGRPELAAVAAPLATAIVLAALATPSPAFEAELSISDERCLQEDVITATITITAPSRWDEVATILALPPQLELLETSQPLVLPLAPRERQDRVLKLRARRWGAYEVGLVGIRAVGPGRLIRHEQILDLRTTVKVFPRFEEVRRTIPPLETQIYTGDYVARTMGDGIEFATVRPFSPGDSIRRVNWRVTSRSEELHVNLAQPERNADVVLFLDTFGEVDLGGETTLDLTVRGAAAIARHHLRRSDRIGLVSFGGALRWLTASMGRTHAFRVADFLIDVNATFSFVWKDIELLPHGTLPPSAMVIAFSPLTDDRAMKALADINTRGFPVVVVNTLTEDAIRPGDTEEGRLAYRAWRLQRELKRDQLASAGIPVVDWSAEDRIELALAQLPRRQRRLMGRR